MHRFRSVLLSVIASCLSLFLLLSGFSYIGSPAEAAPQFVNDSVVVEHLRLKVPHALREHWIEVERESWEPWLEKQSGFLGRDLFWDPSTEEGTLLIRWSSRKEWKSISTSQVAAVQNRFETFEGFDRVAHQ